MLEITHTIKFQRTKEEKMGRFGGAKQVRGGILNNMEN